MNNAGREKRRVFVILNDNEMSIAPPVGAMSSYLSGLYANEPLAKMKSLAEGFEAALPSPLRDGAKRARQLVTGLHGSGTLFEELGFEYVGLHIQIRALRIMYRIHVIPSQADAHALPHHEEARAKPPQTLRQEISSWQAVH